MIDKHPETKPLSYQYETALLAEECAEVTQIIGKSFRFGWDSSDPAVGTPNIDLLHNEVGDVEAAIEFACRRGLLQREKIDKQKSEKLAKLNTVAPPSMVSEDHVMVPKKPVHHDVSFWVMLAIAAAILSFSSFALGQTVFDDTIKLDASKAAVKCFQETPGPACDSLQALAIK